MEDRAGRTRETYDIVARRFLENTRDRSVILPWLNRFAESLPWGVAVLDVGAGPGLDSAELSRRGLRPIALDVSLGMLRIGRAEHPGPRVQADARRLPLPDASIHGIWANASLLHLSPEEAADALGEARRVLRTDGLVHVSVKAGSGAAWEAERYGEPRWFQYWSGADFDALLAEAGFRTVGSWSNSTPRADWLVRHAVPVGRGPTRRRS